MLQIVENAKSHLSNIAIKSNELSYTYQDLLTVSQKYASDLLADSKNLMGARVAFMVDPGFDYVAIQWAIWQAGGVAVPLCISYPLPSLRYVLEDTGAAIVIATPSYEEVLKPLIEEKTFRFVSNEELDKAQAAELPEISRDQNAMILYTSGTTSLPKGVVTTHKNLEAQISTLVSFWEWSAKDHTLCILPLHHVHGIVNVISCALWSGATVEFMEKFSPAAVFDVFMKNELNVFMAVPTIYYKLITYWEQQNEETKVEIFKNLSAFRLMVSGSAALPVSVMEKWKTISGHTLLERYGMTEIGMGVSNPYNGERKAGYIGQPLPGVSVILVDEDYKEVETGQPGEILIKGDNVFKEYWGKPEATQKAFTPDGWFKTGDVAVYEEGYLKILGRDSIDIIKSGGYKISALEIEEVLRKHPEIKDCAVIGVPNEEWGELVAAAVVLNNQNFNTDELNDWIRDLMPAYKTPRKYLSIEDLPRNAMGKVTKNDLKTLFK